MKKTYFTVGPGQLHKAVKPALFEALQQDVPSISHRSAAFSALYLKTKTNLFNLWGIPQDYHFFLTGSGLEAMERITQNMVYKSSFHFVGGSFATKWADFALKLGKKPVVALVSANADYDLSKIKIPTKAEAIAVTLNETSMGVYLGADFLRTLHKQNPDKLLMVDMVSCAPYPQVEWKHVDAVFFSAQKGFGLPAGMGVMIVSPRALKKSAFIESKGVSTGTYHRFASLEKMEQKNQTPETPNALCLFLLNAVFEDMLKEGIEAVRRGIDARAKLFYDLLDSHKTLKPAVKNTLTRSPHTIVVTVPGEAADVIKKLTKKGFIVSSGYAEGKKTQIRIANYPAHTTRMTRELIKVLSRIK